jgi:hypothetical protein
LFLSCLSFSSRPQISWHVADPNHPLPDPNPPSHSLTNPPRIAFSGLTGGSNSSLSNSSNISSGGGESLSTPGRAQPAPPFPHFLPPCFARLKFSRAVPSPPTLPRRAGAGGPAAVAAAASAGSATIGDPAVASAPRAAQADAGPARHAPSAIQGRAVHEASPPASPPLARLATHSPRRPPFHLPLRPQARERSATTNSWEFVSVVSQPAVCVHCLQVTGRGRGRGRGLFGCHSVDTRRGRYDCHDMLVFTSKSKSHTFLTGAFFSPRRHRTALLLLIQKTHIGSLAAGNSDGFLPLHLHLPICICICTRRLKTESIDLSSLLFCSLFPPLSPHRPPGHIRTHAPLTSPASGDIIVLT